MSGRRTSINDVAKAAGVAIKTVSRVLNNEPNVREETRAQVLAALSCVDHIVAFAEDTPVDLVRAIQPAVYVKGGDYTREMLPEAPVVEALGGEVRILPYVHDRSTTGLIERIRAAADVDGALKPTA